MDKKPKAILIFSIIYLLLILMSLLLFGYSFEKVPLNFLALRRNFFSSSIDQEIYLSGLYHKELTYYFIPFPSSNVYLTDMSINVTNSDMENIGIVFTLVYQLVPEQIYSLYQSLSSDYETYIIGSVKGIISNYFMGVHQENRAIIQTELIQRIAA